jgi:hypothetical protein
MPTWQYTKGHAWAYDSDEIPGSMTVRFDRRAKAEASHSCECRCGTCRPDGPHRVEDGCVCGLIRCHCLDHAG